MFKEFLVKSEFTNWLIEHDQDAIAGKPNHTNECPVNYFLKQFFATPIVMTDLTIEFEYYQAIQEILPDWATEFYQLASDLVNQDCDDRNIEESIFRHDRTITFGQSLQIMREMK